MKMKLLVSIAVPALLAAVLAGCTTPATVPTSPEPVGAACPTPANGEQLFTDEADGYCVLIPSGFSLPADPASPSFVGPNTDGSPAIAWISVEDDQNMTATDWAIREAAQVMEDLAMTVEHADVTVAGETGVMAQHLPGQDTVRKVYVAHGGKLYVLTFSPSDPRLPAHQAMLSLYDTMIASFTFLQ